MKRYEYLNCIMDGLLVFNMEYEKDPELRDLDLSAEEWSVRLNNFGEDECDATDKQPTNG